MKPSFVPTTLALRSFRFLIVYCRLALLHNTASRKHAAPSLRVQHCSSMGTCSSSLKKRTSTVHDVDHAGAAVGKKGADKGGKNTPTELAGNGILRALYTAVPVVLVYSSPYRQEGGRVEGGKPGTREKDIWHELSGKAPSCVLLHVCTIVVRFTQCMLEVHERCSFFWVVDKFIPGMYRPRWHPG